MQRKVQKRSDGLLFVTLPRNTGFFKGEVIEIVKDFEQINTDNNMNKILSTQNNPNKIHKYSDNSLIPDPPSND